MTPRQMVLGMMGISDDAMIARVVNNELGTKLTAERVREIRLEIKRPAAATTSKPMRNPDAIEYVSFADDRKHAAANKAACDTLHTAIEALITKRAKAFNVTPAFWKTNVLMWRNGGRGRTLNYTGGRDA